MEYSEAEKLHIKTSNRLDNSQLEVFIGACTRYGLNPLANQIYPRVSNKRLSFMTGIDGYRAIADRTGCYAGNDDPVFDDEGKPRKATVTVYKIVGGARCPFSATARWDQYYPGDSAGRMWKKMPHLMLGKCAEALALRKAFPAQLSGLYTQEEMEQAGPQINHAIEEPVKQEPTNTETKSDSVLGSDGVEQMMMLLDSCGASLTDLRSSMSAAGLEPPQDPHMWPESWLERIVTWCAKRETTDD